MPPTPSKLFAGFLAQAERSPLTLKNDRGDLAAFAAWFEDVNGEPMGPAKVTPTDRKQYKRWLVEQRQLNPSSVNRKLATLKSFLTWAAAVGIAPGLPVPAQGRSWSGPRSVPQERPGPRWLGRREQNALLRVVKRAGKPRDLAVVRLLLNTGLRVQELCDLTWKDVALSERKGLLTVRQGKGGKHRQVPLNHDARAALTDLGYAQHAGEKAVILQGQRGPMTPRGVQTLLARHGALAQREDLSPHALRHTFCKNLIDAGVGLEQVADDEAYRRRILTQLNRGESRHGVARAIFHGQRGELRQRYREGQKDQLGALGLVVNAVVLWNTRYLDAALAQVRTLGATVKPEDEERLSPLLLGPINVLGRYELVLTKSVRRGKLRPLRAPKKTDDLAA